MGLYSHKIILKFKFFFIILNFFLFVFFLNIYYILKNNTLMKITLFEINKEKMLLELV